MATKLEKAQIAYERLLRELGSRAEMVDELDKADPTIHKKYLRAKEAVADRKFELEMLKSEIKRTDEDSGQSKNDLEEEMADCGSKREDWRPRRARPAPCAPN